ncbi:site-specific integrase [Rhizobium leguminosarum]|uniref:site-specific integrase n=1 Tax=Rhizobium leguminosarum TaxID=384 RepID=UPI001442826F|nr:site-specific integrase [Rhizobium leguminosarum]NKL60073.1 hypothetical protein [Rhizobium leguminosarum bv. viciae]
MVPTALKSAEEHDYKMYVALRQASPIRPPYSADFEVTTKSSFGEDLWLEPAELFAAGHASRSAFNFRRLVTVRDKREFRFEEQHRTLLLQLKQAVVSFKFNRAQLKKRNSIVSPRTVFRDAEHLHILFANFAVADISSLSELTPEIVADTFRQLSNSDKSHDSLVRYFEHVVTLSQQGLILNGVPKGAFSVELRENKQTAPTPIARTLDDDELSFLIHHALFYIDNAEQLIAKLIDYKEGLIVATDMQMWMVENLPNVSIRKAWYAEQLITAIRVSGYVLIAFHLGSRISEVLSADGDLATSEVDNIAQLEKVIATLTIFKGTVGGKKRQYEVHPYILRVATVLRKLNAALGLDEESLLFRQTDGKYAVTVNNMNAKLKRFASMHGATFNYTSHSLRYSLADIVTGALEHPFSLTQRRLGHKFLNDSVRYGANGPAGTHLKQEAVSAAMGAISRFVARLDHEESLGGLQGKRLSTALLDGTTKLQIVNELNALGVVPVEVSNDEFCLKDQRKRGKCSELMGDTFPEPESCTALCNYQVQFKSRLAYWESFIGRLDALWTLKKPLLSKIGDIEKLKENIVAWPELKLKLDAKLAAHPELRTWFE